MLFRSPEGRAPTNAELIATGAWPVACAMLAWPPWSLGSSVSGVLMLAAFGLPVVLGLLWLTRLIDAALSAARTRVMGQPSGRWLALPLAAVAVTLVVASEIALEAGRVLPAYTLGENRKELDVFVAGIRDGSIDPRATPVTVGAMTIRIISTRGDCIFLADSTSPDGESGLAHSPAGPPPGFGDWAVRQSTRHIDGPWYSYSLLDE